MAEQTYYLCSIDGYDPDNSARWCGCGCGSDFNRMVPVDMAGALKAADERIRTLGRWLTKAHGECYRANKHVAELEIAVRDCRWGVVDGMDVNSAVILPREDWERLQAASKGKE